MNKLSLRVSEKSHYNKMGFENGLLMGKVWLASLTSRGVSGVMKLIKAIKLCSSIINIEWAISLTQIIFTEHL